MNEQKSLIHHLVEAIDRYRAERHAVPAEGEASQFPSRLRPLLHWLTPNGGTLLLVAALIVTVQVWAKPLTSPTNAPCPSATTVNYQGRLADSGAGERRPVQRGAGQPDQRRHPHHHVERRPLSGDRGGRGDVESARVDPLRADCGDGVDCAGWGDWNRSDS